MDCKNCTVNVTESITVEEIPIEHYNCWIVMIVSLIIIIGLYKLARIVLRILAPLSWFPNDLHKKYVPESVKSWALVTGSS